MVRSLPLLCTVICLPLFVALLIVLAASAYSGVATVSGAISNVEDTISVSRSVNNVNMAESAVAVAAEAVAAEKEEDDTVGEVPVPGDCADGLRLGGGNGSAACAWFPAPGGRRQCCCLTLSATDLGAGASMSSARVESGAALAPLAALTWRVAGRPYAASGTDDDEKQLARAMRSAASSGVGGLVCLPSLIIVGAQKSGTTALLGYLLHHPQYAPALQKELHHFDREDRLFGRPPGSAGVAGAAAAAAATTNRRSSRAPVSVAEARQQGGFVRYLSLLPSAWHEFSRQHIGGAPEGTSAAAPAFAAYVASHITGDSTPSYMLGTATAARLATALPDARIVALLREPVARAQSEYEMKLRRVRAEVNLDDSATADRVAAELLSACNVGGGATASAAASACLARAIHAHAGLKHLVRAAGGGVEAAAACLAGVLLRTVAAAADEAGACLRGRRTQREPHPGAFEALAAAEAQRLRACSQSAAAPGAWAEFAAVTGLMPDRAPSAPGALVTAPLCGGSPGAAAADARVLLDGRPGCWERGATSNIVDDYLYRGVYLTQLARLAAHFPPVRCFFSLFFFFFSSSVLFRECQMSASALITSYTTFNAPPPLLPAHTSPPVRRTSC